MKRRSFLANLMALGTTCGAGAALLLPETGLAAGELAPLLIALERDRERCHAMGAAARDLARPDATVTVMRHCLEVAA